MAKITTLQTSFVSGRASKRVLGRVDLQAYDQAVSEMVNAYPFIHGGAQRRPGTIFIGEVRNSARPVRLVPYVNSRTQSYVLVFNDGFIQFLKDAAYIESAPNVRVEIAHPYNDAQIFEMTYTQFGTGLFFAQEDNQQQQLTRISDVSWTLTPLVTTYNAITDKSFENAYIAFKLLSSGTPFVVGDNFVFTTDGSGNISSGPTFTGTGTGGISAIDINVPNDVGEIWTIQCIFATDLRQEWSVSGSVTGAVTSTWITGDYPAACATFQQRLYFGGSPSRPQTIWGSSLLDPFNFTPGPDDDDGIQVTMASGRLDQVVHISSARQLLVQTVGGEFSMIGGARGITPSSTLVQDQTFHGTNEVKPFRIGREVLFVQRDGNKIRGISFDVTLDANTAPDITVWSEDITESGVIDASFAQDPDYIAWLPTNDGRLLSLTLERDQNVIAWSHHTTGELTDGDPFDVTNRDSFESVATIPILGANDETYASVIRTVDGNTVRYMEYLDYVDGAQTDSALFGVEAIATDTWTGLEHLEGREVCIVADGGVHAPRTVASGTIVLDRDVNSIEVGLCYITTIELLHPEVALGDGTAQGRKTSIHEAVLRFQDTNAARVNDVEVPFRNFGDPLDQPPPLFTGDKKVAVLGWNSPLNLKITQTVPLPWTLLAVILKISVND